MIPFSDSLVEQIFLGYPVNIRVRMYALRDLIYTTASKIGVVNTLVETLKWGEPSYLSESGSTVRIGWKQNEPQSYRMYFHCQTKLVETFREIYTKNFVFEGNRAIRFELSAVPDLLRLESCVEAALTYHKVKNLPNLGIDVIKPL